MLRLDHSTLKPIDPTCYALRFLPRRNNSRWANSNRERALRLLREDKMTSAGMATLPEDVITAWEDENRDPVD